MIKMLSCVIAIRDLSFFDDTCRESPMNVSIIMILDVYVRWYSLHLVSVLISYIVFFFFNFSDTQLIAI